MMGVTQQALESIQTRVNDVARLGTQGIHDVYRQNRDDIQELREYLDEGLRLAEERREEKECE